MVALEVRNLSCSYSSRAILDDLSLQVGEDEIMCLLGASGCGKTTLLKAIAGLLPVTQGEIHVRGQQLNGQKPNGKRVAVVPERRNIGMIFQDYALFPHLNVANNVAFGLESKQSDKALIKKRVAEVLALVSLTDLGERFPHQLSGGQQQRVAIARAMIGKPELMLLDEPFSNIDSQERMRLISEIRALLKGQGIGAIFVTHSKEEAFAFSDRLALFRCGQIEQVGRPQRLYQQPKNRFVADFLGLANYLPASVISSRTLLTPIGTVESQSDLNAGPGCKGQLMLRPQQIQLSLQGEFNGRVIEQQFLGTHTHCVVECQNELLKVSTTEPLPDASPVHVSVLPHALTFFSELD